MMIRQGKPILLAKETNEQINNFLNIGPRDFERRSASSKGVWGNVASENV